MAIVLPALGVVAGWLFATSQSAMMGNKIDQILEKAIKAEAKSEAHDRAINCAELRLFALENGVKRVPDCANKGN